MWLLLRYYAIKSQAMFTVCILCSSFIGQRDSLVWTVKCAGALPRSARYVAEDKKTFNVVTMHLWNNWNFNLRREFVIFIVAVYFLQLLQSFKIMDYSLLLGIHNMDQACRDRGGGTSGDSGGSEGAVTPDQRRPQAQRSLYCTAMESIQGEARGKGALDSEDQWVVPLGSFCSLWPRHKIDLFWCCFCRPVLPAWVVFQLVIRKERGCCSTLASLTFSSHTGRCLWLNILENTLAKICCNLFSLIL